MSNNLGVLQSLSRELEGAVESAGSAVVRVDDGTRLTASGTIWTEDGVIVATSHGVERDEDLTIETAAGERFSATVVGRDPDSDIAVLRADAKGLKPLPQATAEEAKVGALVLALGRPGRGGLQATMGIINSVHAVKTRSGEGRMVHTDAVFYPGFSGGALVNTEGRFVGLVNLGWGRGRGVAIGAGLVLEAVDALLQHGSIRRGYLGITSQPARLPEADGKQRFGLLVTSVEAGSAAHLGNLMLGDTILRINDSPISDPHDLRHLLRSLREGDVATIVILRAGEERTLTVTLGARP